MRQVIHAIVTWLTTKPQTKAAWCAFGVAVGTLLVTVRFNTESLRQNKAALLSAVRAIEIQEKALSTTMESLRVEQSTRLHPDLECMISSVGCENPAPEARQLLVRNVGAVAANNLSLEMYLACYATSAVAVLMAIPTWPPDNNTASNRAQEYQPKELPDGPKAFFVSMFSSSSSTSTPTDIPPGCTCALIPCDKELMIGVAMMATSWEVEKSFGQPVLIADVSYQRRAPTLRTYRGRWLFTFDPVTSTFVPTERDPSIHSILNLIESCPKDGRYLVDERAARCSGSA